MPMLAFDLGNQRRRLLLGSSKGFYNFNICREQLGTVWVQSIQPLKTSSLVSPDFIAFDENDSSVEEVTVGVKFRNALLVAFSPTVAANHSKSIHSSVFEVLKMAFSWYCRLPMRSQNNAKNFHQDRPPLLLETCT
jgi:hypothetical protein